MKFTEKTCMEFVTALSDKTPVPGGGGASAMVAAIGIALGNMVGNYTVGKKKYADVEADVYELMEKATFLQAEFLRLVEEDAIAFEPLSKAYALPKQTAKEQQKKAEIMEAALKAACSVPLELMKRCCEAINLFVDFAKKGSVIAISDAGVGVIFCKAALQGASLNVFINTKSMKDTEYAKSCNEQAEKMLAEYTMLADTIFAQVKERL
jgi:Methenyl tetrahydrofolate cyclohydrolase